LECWNDGILEKWVLGYWSVGIIALRGGRIKLKTDNFLLKTQYSIIPIFHHSMIEAKTQPSKIPYILIEL